MLLTDELRPLFFLEFLLDSTRILSEIHDRCVHYICSLTPRIGGEMLTTVGENLGLVVLLVVILFFGKVVLDILVHLLHRTNADHELSEKDNPAFGISFFGFLVGLAIATLSGIARGEVSYSADVALMVTHGAFTIAALVVAWIINDKCILYRISNAEAIFAKRNVGVGIVESGSFIATSLVLSGAWTSGGWGAVLTWFIVGQIMFVAVAFLYQKITPYDIHSEVASDNIACAIGFAGFLIAAGELAGKAIAGPSTHLGTDLLDSCVYLVIGLATLVVIRLLIGRVFLRTSQLNKEISRDRNPNAGMAEAVIYGITALAFTALV
jgi:uncharacterized membrane protein YjfL (UPF0719 family)